MAKKQNSMVEDIVGIASLLPWWVDVGIAGGSYLGIHHFAAPVVAQPGAETSAAVNAQLVHVLAQFGQYCIPALFLIGAGLSIKNQIAKRGSKEGSSAANPDPAPASVDATPPPPPGVAAASKPKAPTPKDGLGWREFEIMVGEVFRHQGYAVTETATGADGGVDLELRHGDQLYLVQCKHWKSDVGVKVLRELAGVVAGRGATGGFLVTSGKFTEPAKQEFTEQDKVFLVDGWTLKGMVAEVANRPDLAPPPPEVGPPCPRCGGSMVERTARRGQHVGSMFWGCASYPKCRGIRNIESASPGPGPTDSVPSGLL